MCPRITESGNNVLFPNLAHSGVARNGQKWQCNCFQIWLILELPGMAMVCAQEFPKVHGNNVLFPNLALSVAMYMFPNLALSGVANSQKWQ